MTATDVVWLVAMVTAMALVVIYAFWYFRKIQEGRIDPIISPDWTSMERPALPPTAINWGSGDQPDLADDSHIGRPFPPK